MGLEFGSGFSLSIRVFVICVSRSVDTTEDLRKQLFQLPAMVSDRSGAREGSLESEIESLKSSLEYERTKNCKIKVRRYIISLNIMTLK